MVNDTIADMLTRLRNAILIQSKEVLIPKTKMNLLIANILLEEGFISSFQEIEDQTSTSSPFFMIGLKYKGKTAIPYLTNLTRISKPGLRVYANKNEMAKVLGGIGISIVSTSQGVMTDRQARRNQIGGEILCHVW